MCVRESGRWRKHFRSRPRYMCEKDTREREREFKREYKKQVKSLRKICAKIGVKNRFRKQHSN